MDSPPRLRGIDDAFSSDSAESSLLMPVLSAAVEVEEGSAVAGRPKRLARSRTLRASASVAG